MLNAAQNLTSKIANVVSSTEQHFEGQVQTTQAVVKNKMATVTLPQELNLFTMSDHKVMELIYETHVHADESFDEDSLFAIVKNILNPATQIVDKIVQGSQVHVENVQEFVPKANFSVPLCTLKQIGSEFCCKAAGEEVAHKTALTILQKLSNYDWEAKAVLAIAAFALEYGDFWMLAQNYQTDHLAKSLAILKRVPVLTKPLELQKKRQAVIELNEVIKTLLQVIQLFDEFEKISINYDHKAVPHVKVALDHIPVDVYWTILTIVACATKLNLLISDEEKPLDLSPYSQKVHYINNKLRIQLAMCRKQIEVIVAYQKLLKLISTPTEIMEFIKALFFIKDAQPIIDGSTNKLISLEVLRKKYVLLFMSGLDITDEDIEDMKVVHEGTKKENKYSIVWIPIVERWTDELRKKFETLRAKMPWFIVPSFSSPHGFKFIKEVWQFKGKPMVVVLNPRGKQENDDAFHLIKIWKMEAFPFDETKEAELNEKEKWIEKVLPSSVHPQLPNWIKEDKYIFLYGGKDNTWIQEFTKIATAFVNDPIFKESNIKIELACVGKTAKGGEDHGILSRFWGGIESLFFTKSKKPAAALNPVQQQIHKLMSYKNVSGWAILTKGTSVILVGHGIKFLRVLEVFDKWKVSIREKGFENGLKEWYNKITVAEGVPCCRLDVPSIAGKAPETMSCPECPRPMETFISYKCCHVDAPASAHH